MRIEMAEDFPDFPYPYWENVPWLINKYGLRQGVELGVLRGRTLAGILKRCPEVHMVGVDAWCDLPGGFDYAAVLKNFSHDENHRVTLEKVKPYNDRVEIIRDTTTNASRPIDDNSIDIVYVDAGHDYDNVKADIKNWMPKLKPGGWMTGDDYEWPGVQKAVNETIPTADVWKNKFWYLQV